MAEIKLCQVLRGTLVTETGKKTVGEFVRLPGDVADRLIAAGDIAQIEQSPGFLKVDGKTWVRLGVKLEGVAPDDPSGGPGDIVHIASPVAEKLITEGKAERISANRGKENVGLTFSMG